MVDTCSYALIFLFWARIRQGMADRINDARRSIDTPAPPGIEVPIPTNTAYPPTLFFCGSPLTSMAPWGDARCSMSVVPAWPVRHTAKTMQPVGLRRRPDAQTPTYDTNNNYY